MDSQIVKQVFDELYTTNEYGYTHQLAKGEPSEELIAYFKKHYNIRTDVHRMCVACQIRQLTKYADFGKEEQKGKFLVKCDMVPKSLPAISSVKLKELSTQLDIPEDRAKRLLLSTIDPAAWAELMFGFDDKDPRWRLRPYQREQVRCRGQRVVLREGRRAGKALSIETPIPTPKGWRKMLDLEEGDEVFDENGNPCNVTLATPVMYNHDCYTLKFNDGETIVADGDHRWWVETKSLRKSNQRNKHLRHKPVILTTKEMLANLKVGKKKESNFSIPLAGALKYSPEDISLPVDPYVLGYWLGDGTRGLSQVTTGLEDQEEVLGYIREVGYTCVTTPSDPIQHSVRGLITGLKELGVQNEKKIPERYLRASTRQRLELLKGLMDSDGSVGERDGHSEFTSVDRELAEGVYELLTGLGFKASLYDPKPAYCSGKRCKDKTRIYINTSRPLFKLKRKLSRLPKAPLPASERRYITDITKVDSVPVKCISVDSPNNLYLAGRACIPTHNTVGVAIKLCHYLFNHKVELGYDSEGKRVVRGPKILVITPYTSQLDETFEALEMLLKRNPELASKITTGSGESLYIKTPFYRMALENGASIKGFVSGLGIKQDGSGGGVIRGKGAEIIYLDEMDMIPDDILRKAVDPILTGSPDTILIATSTPIGKRGKFYSYAKTRPDFKEDYYPSTVLPHWDLVKAEVEEEGITQDSFATEYMADFIEGTYGVFKPTYIQAARKDYDYFASRDRASLRESLGISDTNNMLVAMGIDWNKNAGTEFYLVGYSPSIKQWFGLDAVNIPATEFSAQRWIKELIELNFKWRPNWIYADKGYGHTIIDDVHLMSYQLRAKQNKTAIDLETVKLFDTLVAFDFSSNVMLKNPVDGSDMKKPAKEFLVENAIRTLEEGLFVFPHSDEALRKQFGNYIVVRRHATTGRPIYGLENEKIGDHRLDACMLALAALTLEESVYAGRNTPVSTPTFLNKNLREREDKEEEDPGKRLLEGILKGKTTGHFSILNIIHQKHLEEDEKKKETLNTRNSRHKRSILAREEEKPSFLEQLRKKAGTSEGMEFISEPTSARKPTRRGLGNGRVSRRTF